ncbi:hypothetical protein LEP1GSC079_4903 [Leptospira interrogans str. FPW1039]|uniref:Uncharacterized protein n=1 Tax=Leptospira interrogans str. FPW1039 TaxID=1193040 RepID=A0A0F6I7A4_LEPIR|nr:hypothetical protein LEP1GSC099_1651 [Leptospira interrogans str. UI 08452]EMJ33929.1 hypothetical protein LEP1GSC079_4903 [Leptospira interrogans str. FPW1039]EMN35468.1 hypothetical protein LEP1GSC084_0058 [Leptospira interrogans serovar Medanensis str. L0448]EMN38406.1 hypothetical protein LEP1GSC085_0133 [Leptospira interrogans str. L0996]MCR8628929.1 hypothetical protein [Leptospira interrogans serovar Canicola]OQM27392.1 hypothetical protein DV30_19775 [Leptospira interrogans serovar 
MFFTFVSKLKRQRNLLKKIYGSNIPLNIAKFEIPNFSLHFPPISSLTILPTLQTIKTTTKQTTIF